MIDFQTLLQALLASKAAGQEESVNASNQAECDPFPAASCWSTNACDTRTYELLCQLCFVSIGLRSLDGQDDAIGNDGEEDGILKGWPFDEEYGEAADEVALAQDEEGGGALLLLLR